MARVPIPIPGKDKDYDSRKSRAQLINLMVDVNQDGSFKAITKREGVFASDTTSGGDSLTSNFSTDGHGDTYVSGTTNLYFVNGDGTLTSKGAHGISTFSNTVLRLISNDADPDAQTFIFNPGGISTPGFPSAAVYEGGPSPLGFTEVSDVTWVANSADSGTYLNTQFWFVASSTNATALFYGSDSLDGLIFDPLAFSTATEEVGLLLATRSYKSSIWFFKEKSIEYWSIFNDPTVPLRSVTGASKRVGIARSVGGKGDGSIDQLYEYIGFLGNDQRVYLMTGSVMEVVSDIDFANIMTDNSDGFGALESNVAVKIFFIDTGNHRYLCATSTAASSSKKFTWVYDLKTKKSHYRKSPSLEYWDYYLSTTFTADTAFGQKALLIASELSDTLFTMSRSVFDDDGTDFECVLQTGSVSYDQDSTIEHIEVEMETGVGNSDSADPEMLVEYSKDGGVNFFTHSTVKLGASTDKSNRITLYNFGRLVRHTDFVLRLTIEEPVRVDFYGIYAEITGGF